MCSYGAHVLRYLLACAGEASQCSKGCPCTQEPAHQTSHQADEQEEFQAQGSRPHQTFQQG